jgi:hypothetical protein
MENGGSGDLTKNEPTYIHIYNIFISTKSMKFNQNKITNFTLKQDLTRHMIPGNGTIYPSQVDMVHHSLKQNL